MRKIINYSIDKSLAECINTNCKLSSNFEDINQISFLVKKTFSLKFHSQT